MKKSFRSVLLALCVLAPQILRGGESKPKSNPLLGEIEAHYRTAKSVKMGVDKLVKLKLLDKEKKSKGTIQIKRGGKLRWETETPDHSLVLVDGRVIWLVDFPADAEEKPSVIKATNPRKSQPHAVVAFLMGQGKISDDFAVVSQTSEGPGEFKLDLKPRQNVDQVQWLTLYVDKGDRSIDKLSFEDSIGNVTELKFKNIEFDKEIKSEVFKFKPPKNADVTVIN